MGPDQDRAFLTVILGTFSVALTGAITLFIRRAKPGLSDGWAMVLAGCISALLLTIIWKSRLVDWLLSVHVSLVALACVAMVAWLLLFLWAYFTLEKHDSEIGRTLEKRDSEIDTLCNAVSDTGNSAHDYAKSIGEIAEERLGTRIAEIRGDMIQKVSPIELRVIRLGQTLDEIQERLKRIEGQG